MEQYNNSLLFLKERLQGITILDVGCARGAFLKVARSFFDDVFSVGIDPLDHGVGRWGYAGGEYNSYLQVAIDDIKDRTGVVSDFYVNQDDQASSLLEMDFDSISDEIGDQDKYFIQGAKRLSILGKLQVPVLSLENVIDQNLKGGDIHFLKIDAEGKDLDIVKSLGKYLQVPMFVSLECSSHSNDKIRIFKNGCHLKEVLEFMGGAGFSVFERFDYEFEEGNRTQMSDLIFVNEKI